MTKEVTLKCGKCGFEYLYPENENCPSCRNSSEWGLEQLEEEHEQRRGVEKLKEGRVVQEAKLPKAPLPLPPAVADYAARLSKAYWRFLARHVEAYESGKLDISATCIVKESEGALQALADVFGLPALKAALEVRGELCPIVCQHTDERLIAKY
jgi:hypothetical protein